MVSSRGECSATSLLREFCVSFVIGTGNMKIYKIQDISRNDFCCTVTVTRFGGKCWRILELPRTEATDKLKRHNHILALSNVNDYYEDYVYIYRGGCHFNVAPLSADFWSCRAYIENLGPWAESFDRDILEYVLYRECRRRGIKASLTMWHNLQNIMIDCARGGV